MTYLGEIESIELQKSSESRHEVLVIRLPFSAYHIWDAGQSCCERRYMTCDDDLTYFVGADLLGFRVADGPDMNPECEGYEHITQFLIVSTSKGEFTVCTHNEHNGYYGGFDLCIKHVEGP